MNPDPAEKGLVFRLADSPDLYRLLVESVEDYAIFAFDPKGYILSWNSGARRLKGYDASEIVGSHISIFYSASERAAGLPERHLETAERHGRFEGEGWRVRKDGSRFWAAVAVTAMHDDSGELVGFAEVTRDLTERQKAQDALSKSEERFRLMVQTVRDYGIFMLDTDGKVATWNEGAARIKGYRADEIIGEHFSRFYPPEDVARRKPDHELTVAVREGRYEDEGWRIRKDGSRFWANVVITTLRSADGRHIGFAKVTRDLTERRAAEKRALSDARHLAIEEAARYSAEEKAAEQAGMIEQLRQQAEELAQRTKDAEDANRVKSDFLASMSHELRTPLNAIAGYTQLLELGLRGPVTDEQHRDLERIRTSQQHLLAVINDILNFSRLEAGQLSYQIEDVPVPYILESMEALMSPVASGRQVNLEIAPCPANAVVHADRGKVEQILINLIGNAVKFTPPGGNVWLECRLRPNAVVIAVRDTGIGVEPDHLEPIFDPFVQVGRSLTQHAEGTGLGLAISRDLARAMDGDVTVESEPGKGSTFSLVLPSAEQLDTGPTSGNLPHDEDPDRSHS
jgi:PAS domain S-box-containing protein